MTLEDLKNKEGAETADQKLARQILTLIDLTSLTSTETHAEISALCSSATSSGNVAAVCVYPAYISQAALELKNTPVKIAAVANFPEGMAALASVLTTIKNAIEDGANEIDLVFPYKNYLAGERHAAMDFVKQCKNACGKTVLLKVILETGALKDAEIIASASRDVIAAGADFIKTSTGKIAIGATREAAEIMLQAIKEMTAIENRTIGFKASGGIREISEAVKYLDLAKKIMGAEWISPATFRFGTSRLLK